MLRVGVNVSGRQLADPLLPVRFERIVAGAGVDPRLLLLEVTETALIEHDVRAAASLHALAELGCTSAQGWLWARPMPAAGAEAWYAAHH